MSCIGDPVDAKRQGPFETAFQKRQKVIRFRRRRLAGWCRAECLETFGDAVEQVGEHVACAHRGQLVGVADEQGWQTISAKVENTREPAARGDTKRYVDRHVKPFVWRYRYSELDCVDVTRTSFWHKVYVSIWSKADAGSDWSSMVLNRKLSDNETLHRCENGSYQLKVGVEARNTDHYNISFDD